MTLKTASKEKKYREQEMKRVKPEDNVAFRLIFCEISNHINLFFK